MATEDATRIRQYLVERVGLPANKVRRNFHLTVYHARREMPGITSHREPAHVKVAGGDTRFMVLAPGGENPRADILPATKNVGVRIVRSSATFGVIAEYRQRLIRHETPEVLGTRKASTLRRSAFGARSFQPHISLVWPNSRIPEDLVPIGVAFRKAFRSISFSEFIIDVKDVEPRSSGNQRERFRN